MEWFIIIAAGISTVLGLWLSRPERKKLAIMTTLLVVIITVWNSVETYQETKAKSERLKRVYDDLSKEQFKFLTALSAITVQSSDGWLPTNENEFFSARVTELICRQLNLDSKASFSEDQSLRDWLSRIAQNYRSQLKRVISESSEVMDADLISAISEVEKSGFLTIAQQSPSVKQFDDQHGFIRPPLLCWGLDSLTTDFLSKLHRLQNETYKGEKRFDIERPRDWIDFPQHYKAKYLGISRFSPEDLAQWFKEHPNSLGPFGIGQGDMNKRQTFRIDD